MKTISTLLAVLALCFVAAPSTARAEPLSPLYKQQLTAHMQVEAWIATNWANNYATSAAEYSYYIGRADSLMQGSYLIASYQGGTREGLVALLQNAAQVSYWWSMYYTYGVTDTSYYVGRGDGLMMVAQLVHDWYGEAI